MKQTDKQIQELVDAVETARQLHCQPPDVQKALSALQGIFTAQEPFREQPARVTLAKFYSRNPDGSCKAYEPFDAVELTDAVRSALDAAGVKYE